MASFPPTVRTIVDGNPVSAAYTEGPLQDLTQRTDWLYAQILALMSSATLLLRSQVLFTTLPVGTPVYFDIVTSTYKAAFAAVNSDTFSTAAASAQVTGIISNVSGTSADIVPAGYLKLTTGQWAAIFDTGVFAAGPVYLSTIPGKISSLPGSLSIYLGTLQPDGSIVIVPVNGGAYLDHIHLERFLVGAPAGTVVDPAFGGTQSVNTPNAALQGWLPANATYFPGYVSGVQIPTGAKFGYNIQQTSETALRAIFPVLPPENAQFSQSGLILSTASVVINQYGIWWMTDAYGTAPWPVDYAVTATAAPITLWTTRLTADVSLSETITNQIFSELANGVLATMGVTRAIPGDSSVGISGPHGDNTNGWYGPITITNNGVRNLKGVGGVGVTGTIGDATVGWAGGVTLRSIASRPLQYVFSQFTSPQVTPTVPVTSNGVPSGINIAMYGYGLGPGSTDYIDFLLQAGTDFDVSTAVQFTLNIAAFVDTVAGSVTSKLVDVNFYRLDAGAPSSSTSFVRVFGGTINTGLPGVMQNIIVPNFSDVTLAQNRTWLIRLTNNSSPGGLAGGTLRVVSAVANLVAP